MDEASLQLHHELRKSLQDELSSRRPLVHDLHQTWLIQVPRPASSVRNGARFYYNLLILKWLQPTGAIDDSPVEWRTLITGIEALAEDLRTKASQGRRSNVTVNGHGEQDSLVDAVIVTASDVSRKTLSCIHPDVPIFTNAQAAQQIDGWHCFRNVIVIREFEPHAGVLDWTSSSLLLPEWLGINWISQDDTHAALMVTFSSKQGSAHAELANSAITSRTRRKEQCAIMELDDDDESAEAIIYVPSSVGHKGLEVVTSASPPIRTLALIYDPSHKVLSLPSKLQGPDIVHAQRDLKARYWISSKAKIEQRNGFLSWFAPQKEMLTPKGLLDRLLDHKRTRCEQTRECHAAVDETLDAFQDVEWLDFTIGTSRILR
ncbi:Beta-lactamase superfamily domain [Teratosphaeria destructans]|uniref:Beta-lactamase superfamily domain n=1 Tax=Teratosphaeria destructans TaxID=418781 RepID=A0A9W7SY73_9PEZI|nr:Beta-lactamase superfamily domain [Teratosphaeria destructans]